MTLPGTLIPTETSIDLTPAHWENSLRSAQTPAFARRAVLPVPGSPGDEFALLGNVGSSGPCKESCPPDDGQIVAVRSVPGYACSRPGYSGTCDGRIGRILAMEFRP
jgi:hypothetical protein